METNPDTEVEDDAHTSATTVRNLVIVELMEGDKQLFLLILFVDGCWRLRLMVDVICSKEDPQGLLSSRGVGFAREKGF